MFIQHCSLLEKCKSNLQRERPLVKNPQTATAGESMEKRELSCTVGGNVNWWGHHEKQGKVSSKKIINKKNWKK